VERIVTVVDIERTPAQVFEFVTNAAQWKRWHPATVAVSGVPNRALVLGETVDEQIHAGPRRFTARWTVTESKPPRRWVIVTDSAEGEAKISYKITEHEGVTYFERTLEYASKRWPWKWFDGSLTRRLLTRQSEEALRNLKRVIESQREFASTQH
jgi:uncharacterized protein YndB with AHSA1/START domain